MIIVDGGKSSVTEHHTEVRFLVVASKRRVDQFF
jgi:hypothetical protein